MEVGLLPVLALLLLTVAGAEAHNHHEIEVYWHSVLPNAVMPKPLKDLVRHGKMKFDDVFETSDININILQFINYLTRSNQWENLLKTNDTVFFFEADLVKGRKMSLRFPSKNGGAAFLPRHLADSLPFSTDKLPQILNHFSLNPDSKQAKRIRNTLSECEKPGIKGEHKDCATSLEAMIDFAVSELGRTAKVLATEVEGKGERQSYRVTEMKKEGEDSVICHKMYYGYAVYYCHKIEATRPYGVSLVGENGSKVKALAVCHSDTSAWDPHFPAFKILKAKPGTLPICHFLAPDTFIWVA